MDTNAVTALIHALAKRPPAPSSDFWTQLLPYIVMLLIAAAAWIKANTLEKKADIAAVAATEAKDTAKANEEKNTETSKVVDKILVDVNSKSSQQIQRNEELVEVNKQLSGKLDVLQERLRPVIAAAAPIPAAFPPAQPGPITPVLAVPSTLSPAGGHAVPDDPKTGRNIVLTEEQFQQLLERKQS